MEAGKSERDATIMFIAGFVSRFIDDAPEAELWTTEGMPKENGDYLVTVYDDSAGENIVLHCRWDELPVGTEPRFRCKGEDVTDYVIAWMKFPEAYAKTHNPILSDADDAWTSQHM